MRFVWKAVAGLAGLIILAFIAFQVGLSLNASQLGIILLSLSLMGALAWLVSRRGIREPSMELCRTFAIRWWERNFDGESLSRDESFGIEGYVGRTKLYAFRFRRLAGVNADQPVVIVVKAAPLDIFKFSERPASEELRDPFKIIDTEVLRTPVPMDPIPRYYKWMGQDRRNVPSFNFNINQRDNFEEKER